MKKRRSGIFMPNGFRPYFVCRAVSVLALLCVIAFPAVGEKASNAGADELLQRGTEAFRRGDLASAERDWKAADAAYQQLGDALGRVDAALNLAIVYQHAGKFALAIATLNDAESRAASLGADQAEKLGSIKNALGVAYTFTRRPVEAEAALNAALALAREKSNPNLESSVENNLGNLFVAWSEILKDPERADAYAKAIQHYTTAAELAEQSGDAALAARAMVNAALSTSRSTTPADADALNGNALAATRGLPDSADKANLLITIGQTDQALLGGSPASGDIARLQRRAFDAYEQAGTIAKRLGTPLTGSYAAGYQGRLYEMAKRYDESLALTRRAALLAQQAQSPDSLYLWQWQAGRLFKAKGKIDDAIQAYTSARDTLEKIRSDLALGYGNRGMNRTFRSEVGPLYYELADLLLARADTASQAEKTQAYLSEARQTVERLRVGELESYLEDQCVNQAAAKRTDLTKDLGKIQRGNPAVVYFIPLADRIEILVTTRSGMKRFKSADVGTEKLMTEVRTFRRQLERRTTHRYLTNAKQLYQWLIQPIEPMLEAEQIDTLVFVPDGALRTVPMAALHDGKDFLIAKYAVAVSPGLSLRLTDEDQFRPADRSKAARMLATGLSEKSPDSDLPPLPNVEAELSNLQALYGGTTLLNQQFTVPTFFNELGATSQDYSIVHIASHGVFSADIAKTYVLTYDGQLNLTNLEALLRPYQLQNKPIDLLTLSCCQTSAGDDQAALERASLGLGGLAVKAGARSALASLWFADDQATGQLMSAFYADLRDHPEAGKAKALQQAQLSLIRSDDFKHPIYWAPFLMIGDWL